jgi:hypothetical protein
MSAYQTLVEELAAVERLYGPPVLAKSMSTWIEPEIQAALARYVALPRDAVARATRLAKAGFETVTARNFAQEITQGRHRLARVKAQLASMARTAPRPDPDDRARQLAHEITEARRAIGDAMVAGQIPLAQAQVADARLRRLAADRLADAQGRPRQPAPIMAKAAGVPDTERLREAVWDACARGELSASDANLLDIHLRRRVS